MTGRSVMSNQTLVPLSDSRRMVLPLWRRAMPFSTRTRSSGVGKSRSRHSTGSCTMRMRVPAARIRRCSFECSRPPLERSITMLASLRTCTPSFDDARIDDATLPARITGTCSGFSDGSISTMTSAPIPRAAPYAAAAYSWLDVGSVRITSDSEDFSLQRSSIFRNSGTSSPVRNAVAVSTAIQTPLRDD